MNVIQVQRQKIIGFRAFTKRSLEEMLATSEEDYREFKASGRISKLRDASNKLVAIAENLTANAIGEEVDSYGKFSKNFKKVFKNEDLFTKLDSLHVFFYSGLGYEQEASSIEYIYNAAKKRMRTLIKNMKVV